MLLFGPVPSRRLGRSLGVNNIPPKLCSYSCAYCQVGRTRKMLAERRAFDEPRVIFEAVRTRLEALRRAGEKVDYLSFVPDGEPTLDGGLGRTIELLRGLGAKVAVISNASLLDRAEVRRELGLADWVSLKVDCTGEEVWRRVNRPHRALQLASILEGMLEFRHSFRGFLATETMLVEGANDAEEDLRAVAAFLRRLQPETAYLSIPTRPPAERWVRPPQEGVVARAFHLLAGSGARVELLTGSEGEEFTGASSAVEDLLAITSVHPMRRQAVSALLANRGADWSEVEALLEQGRLVETEYQGDIFYLRRFKGAAQQSREG